MAFCAIEAWDKLYAEGRRNLAAHVMPLEHEWGMLRMRRGESVNM